jgi:hypothetical protein
MARKRKRRNRKKRVDGFNFPIPFAGFIVIGVMLFLSYLWLCSRCDELGCEIKSLEKEQVKLENKFLNEEYKWMSMKSPKNIEETLMRYGISMTWPRRDQVVWLADAHGAIDMNSGDVRETNPGLAEVRRGSRYE